MPIPYAQQHMKPFHTERHILRRAAFLAVLIYAGVAVARAESGMDPDDEIVFESPGVIRQYKSGRVERLATINPVPPSFDAATGVTSRDVTIDPATGLWVRLYLPANLSCYDGGRRLPVVIYLHGGALVVGSAADAPDHAFVNRVAARAGALVVSVEYRLAPEHPVPACYDDALAAVRWASAGRDSADPWVRDHADAARVFVLGFSSGGNIAHNILLRTGLDENRPYGGGGDARVKGMVLLHPYFLSATLTEAEQKDAVVLEQFGELWTFACAGQTTGLDDPRINPIAAGAPSLRRLACDRVLVCTASDELEVRGKLYYQALLASGWPQGKAEQLHSAGEEHDFFLTRPDSPNALILMETIVAFIHGDK